MGLYDDVIDVPPAPEPEPSVPDPEEAALDVLVAGISEQLRTGIEALLAARNWIVGRVNEPTTNGVPLTPERVAERLGTEGGSLLDFDATVQGLVATLGTRQGLAPEQIAALFVPAALGLSYAKGKNGELVVTRAPAPD
jgi:hypothetical protein